MAEPIRNEEPITTSDLAGRRIDYAGNPDVIAETQNENLRGPRLVENDFALQDLRDESVNHPDARHEWGTNRLTADTANPNQLADTATPLFRETEISEYRSRWSNVQAGFVDEPRRSVQEADQLVASVMQRLAQGFANERASLEQQWDSGDNVSTEDLRVALQRYRAFFGRLLNVA